MFEDNRWGIEESCLLPFQRAEVPQICLLWDFVVERIEIEAAGISSGTHWAVLPGGILLMLLLLSLMWENLFKLPIEAFLCIF